jgi:hypothetical protein
VNVTPRAFNCIMDDSRLGFDEVPKHAVWVRHSGDNDGVRFLSIEITWKSLVQKVCGRQGTPEGHENTSQKHKRATQTYDFACTCLWHQKSLHSASEKRTNFQLLEYASENHSQSKFEGRA